MSGEEDAWRDRQFIMKNRKLWEVIYTFILLMVRCFFFLVYAWVKINQIVQFTYVQIIACQLYPHRPVKMLSEACSSFSIHTSFHTIFLTHHEQFCFRPFASTWLTCLLPSGIYSYFTSSLSPPVFPVPVVKNHLVA